MVARREFLGYLSVTGLLALSGTAGAARQTEPDGYRAVPTWFGPSSDRPNPSEFPAANHDGEALYIASDTGRVSHLQLGESSDWSTLPVTLKQYADSDLPDPTTLPESHLVHETNRGIPTWNDGNGWEFPVFVDDVKTTPTTVANTTTRTSVFNPDINAMSLLKGRIYQLDLHGTFETTNTSDQFTVDVDIAGTDAASLQNAQENADPGTPWTFELTFSVREDGANGVLKPNTRATFNEQPRTANTGEITVDTTTATQLEVFITWSAADASNSVTVEQAHLKQMG